jgi:chromosome segregation ATPase
VGRAEAALQETSARLTEAQDQLSKLRGEAQASATEVQRLREEIGRLRERADLSQADARETASARDRAKAIAQAALTYAEKGSALSTTRNRMIDVLKEVIAAERDGRSADARQWVDEYNELVPLHNRQVSEAHAALATLRGLL